MQTNHTWHFFRAGGFDQVQLRNGADILALDQLDQKLWMALSCPTRGIEFDTKTLDLIDTDNDGRIRAPEIIAAAKWAGTRLKTPNDLVKSSPSLPLNAINDATPEGKQLLASAKQILVNLGKADATSITAEDTTDTTKIFAQTTFNGDGIIPADSAEDDATKAVINDVIACLGADTDRSGKPGISQAKADQFFAEAQAFSNWWKKAETDPTILPLSDATVSAASVFRSLKPKVDDYFARCRLAAFDSRALAALNREEKEFLALAAKDLTITSTEIAGFPLARIEPGKPLPLKEGVNPAWAGAVAQFETLVIRPLLNGQNAVTEADWLTISDRFAAYEAWSASKGGVAVEKLGLTRVREILASPAKEAIARLVEKDRALEPEANAIAAVDKLVRLHRDLFHLLNNYVSFRDFYARTDKAVFQVGTLYLDQRACDLCVRVDDAAKHAALAGMAKAYLAYCDCVRKSTGEKLTIAAAFTAGDSDNLMVGRNGIFYDRQGRDWDATITKVVENPISIRQAFWSPYKKFVRFIEEQVAKRAAAADAASTAKLQTAAETTVAADQTKPPAPASKKFDVGTVAALGVALGALSAVLAGFVGGFIKLTWWQMPLALLAIMLAISLPSMVIAWLKLRQRNLGPILDANGWAVNARAKINTPFGGSLTQVARLPAGAHRDLADPFAEKKRPWKLWLVLLALVGMAFAWWQGNFDRYLPERARSTSVLGTNAPAYKSPAPVPVEIVPLAETPSAP